MLKTALNINIKPHKWKLVNIVSIPTPNKDIDEGTSYRPISLISVIAKALEKSLLPDITANIRHTNATRVQNTDTLQCGNTHSKQHRSKWVQSNNSPCANINVALDKSKAFDTKNIHTLIRKLLQTKIPGAINMFIANYIKGRKAYTTYINHTSPQRQFKTGVPHGGVLSRTLFNIYTANILLSRTPVQVMAYADDITITSTHTSTDAANTYI